MFARLFKVLAVGICTFMILGICATPANARSVAGVASVSGVSVAGQDWGAATLKIRWHAVQGAKYQLRVADARKVLSRSREIRTSTASGTNTRRLNRRAAYYVQVRAIVHRTKGRWSTPTRVRMTQPTELTTRRPAATPATGKKVFAHYFPPYPISFENASPASDYYAKNYLTFNGENGIWAFCGGLLRDRPLGRAPLAGTDFLVQDLRTEVREAKAAGIDGFTLDILDLSGMNWTASVNLMKAARAEGGFKIVPNLDATAIRSESPATIAAKLAELYRYSSAQVIGGKHVLSSFDAEAKTPAWWGQVLTSLKRTQHIPIEFIAVFLNASYANMKAFAPISYAFGNWGVRTVRSVTQAPNYAARAHALGKRWMEPVAFQDARPRSNLYAEASNTETGRATWEKAINDRADLVQIVTWNDYSESTQVAPSVAHGSVFLDISKYYINWFKTGSAAAVDTDHLYITHRIHPVAARPTSGIVNMSPTLGGMSTRPRDTVEALVFLTSQAQVSITSGGITSTFSKPAGISAATIPLSAGAVSARILRGSTVVKAVNSPFIVTNTPRVQDFQYWTAGN